MVRPAFGFSQPMPPPRVRPATPVWPTVPAGTARPWAWVAASSSPSEAPGPTTARRAAGSTRTSFMRPRSIISPPSVTANPEAPWPPPRTETSQPRAAANRTAAATSAALVHRAIRAGRRSMAPFQIERARS